LKNECLADHFLVFLQENDLQGTNTAPVNIPRIFFYNKEIVKKAIVQGIPMISLRQLEASTPGYLLRAWCY
jgi:hypothetical protein